MDAQLSQRAGIAKTGIDFHKFGKNWTKMESRFLLELEKADSFYDLPADIQKMIVDGERVASRRKKKGSRK
jgi:hypothetical protein